MTIDFSNWAVYEGANEGSGRSEKKWLQNPSTKEIGLFKFKKGQDTKDHISEKVASDLAELLDIPCAKIEIGVYQGREGSISYLINQENEFLIEGIGLINAFYPNYNAAIMYDASLDEYYSLEMLVNSIQPYGLLPDLLKMLIFDYLIGNSDRHQNNWGIINIGDQKYKFCPLYDNSSSLCCYVPEQNVIGYLGNDQTRFYSLVVSKSQSIVRLNKKEKKRPTHEEVFKYMHEQYYEYITELVAKIEAMVNESNIATLLAGYLETTLTQERKYLIQKFLLEKVRLMKQIIEGKDDAHVQ